jgi:hypothetical protein
MVLKRLQEQDVCFYHQERHHILWLVPEQFCCVKTKGCCPDITVCSACLHSKFFIYGQRQFSFNTILL